MTIARASSLSSGAKPVEVTPLCRERILQPSSGSAEASQDAALHEAAKKAPSLESSTFSCLHCAGDGASDPARKIAFVYGTLKRGFGNHWLMEELLKGSHARFLGYARTKQRFPLVCGPFQIPFLLPSPSPSGHHVLGELYQVDSMAISRLDELEGVSKGHYERRPIDVQLISSVLLDAGVQARAGRAEMDIGAHENDMDESNMADLDGMDATSCCTLAGPVLSCRMHMDLPKPDEIDASSSPTDTSGYLHVEAYFACAEFGLRMADCAPYIPCYTEKEGATYVRREDRPHDRTFLEHVHAWIEKQSLIYS